MGDAFISLFFFSEVETDLCLFYIIGPSPLPPARPPKPGPKVIKPPPMRQPPPPREPVCNHVLF